LDFLRVEIPDEEIIVEGDVRSHSAGFVKEQDFKIFVCIFEIK
jgi:hypothetical protein